MWRPAPWWTKKCNVSSSVGLGFEPRTRRAFFINLRRKSKNYAKQKPVVCELGKIDGSRRRRSSMKIDEREDCWAQGAIKNIIQRLESAHQNRLCAHELCNKRQCKITHIQRALTKCLLLFFMLQVLSLAFVFDSYDDDFYAQGKPKKLCSHSYSPRQWPQAIPDNTVLLLWYFDLPSSMLKMIKKNMSILDMKTIHWEYHNALLVVASSTWCRYYSYFTTSKNAWAGRPEIVEIMYYQNIDPSREGSHTRPFSRVLLIKGSISQALTKTERGKPCANIICRIHGMVRIALKTPLNALS